MKKNILAVVSFFAGWYFLMIIHSGCAQIGSPTGGPKDTLAPILVKAIPEPGKLNFTGNKITFTFNEYIEIQELQSNLLVSPLPKNNPVINSNLKTLTVKFKDSLQPNTTYSINFGDAVKDVNEGNIMKNFTYTFSTGNSIDSLEIKGNVQMAESGKTDSSLLVLLYRNAPDSAVKKRKPDYISRTKGDGSFLFTHLPPADFNIYALKDGDGGKTYNSALETFAFYDTVINSAVLNKAILLYAYAEEKAPPAAIPIDRKTEKKLRFSTNLNFSKQDLLEPLEITFTNPMKKLDTQYLFLTDTNFIRIPNTSVTIDSTRTKLIIRSDWKPETPFYFSLTKEALEDSLGNIPAKNDTIRFYTKSITEYGSVMLRFKNLTLSRNPVIQFMDGDKPKYVYPLTSNEWSNKMFPPGEYEIRILYDDNKNGQWDPGNYAKKLQPEKAITLPQKISIRADWDNERDILL